MKINVDVSANHKIEAFYLFFLIASVQIGVGILKVSREVFVFARQDSWLVILIASAAMLVTLLIMLTILKQYKNSDILGIQVDIFGHFIGKAIGCIYVVYYLSICVSLLSTYIEIVQVFMYPTIPGYVISILILTLIIYAILGGLKVVVGVVFIFFILTQILLFLTFYPMSQMDWLHFLPMFQTPLPDLLRGVKATVPSLGGFEFIFLFYPFIKDKKKIKLPTVLAICYTAFSLLTITVISIGYFSLNDILFVEWPGLTIFKSISFSFIERVDYLIVAEWMMVIVPNILIYMWGITHVMKRLFNMNENKTLYIFTVIIFISVLSIKTNRSLDKVISIISDFDLWLIFVYPLILLPLVLIKKRKRKTKGSVPQ